jgi:Fe2+ transport system protein FeoA
VKVCRVGGDRKICAKMANLGVMPGTEMELICPRRGRQCIIKVNGGTLSLDESTAENIFVTKL